MKEGVYGTDLSLKDWCGLRDYVLAACHNEALPSLPKHLEAHPVVQLVRSGKTDEAGKLLAPEFPEKWFIYLAKS